MSCDEVQREVAETGTTHLAVEEMISDSDSESESSVEETSVPAVEMKLAIAPMETIELLEKAEEGLPDPLSTPNPITPVASPNVS